MTFPATARTQGNARAEGTDGAGLRILDRDQCLALLARGRRGRVAISVGALPAILPVEFGLVGEEVVLCLGVGSTLDKATRDVVVAFEADGSFPDGEWSVTLVGVTRELTDPFELQRAEALTLPTWSNNGHRFVAISTDHISGRRAADVHCCSKVSHCLEGTEIAPRGGQKATRHGC